MVYIPAGTKLVAVVRKDAVGSACRYYGVAETTTGRIVHGTNACKTEAEALAAITAWIAAR